MKLTTEGTEKRKCLAADTRGFTQIQSAFFWSAGIRVHLRLIPLCPLWFKTEVTLAVRVIITRHAAA